MRRTAYTHLHLLLGLFLLSSLSFWPSGVRAQAGALNRTTNIAPFDVGVVLNTATWIGKIGWSCVAMAIEDFYEAHPNYTTRLKLHLRESGSDAFGAASAVIDLLKNVQVQAIIGPQASTQAKFVTELGNKTRVPIISFSATSPTLSSKKSPYFIRTAINDSSHAKVIASIVQTFKWREVVLVFEDTEYGTGIVPYLIDAFQEIGARVPYRCMIPLSTTNDQILKELDKLKNMQTRVFIVHMSYSLGFQFFSRAKEVGMMEKGYVWITTYGLTDLVDIMGSAATDVMQGVLDVKPYVRKTKKLDDFNVTWSKKFSQTNLTVPTIFGLWAYDTLWSVALVAEKVGAAKPTFLGHSITKTSTDLETLGIYPNGPKLLKEVQDSNFDGVGGRFSLIDGQLESQVFEIINMVGNGKRRIGFWTPAFGISRHMNLKADLHTIIWPGRPTIVPKGWEWTNGTLRIGVPTRPGFPQFVHWVQDPTNNSKLIPKGYCIDVFEAVMKALPYSVPYEYRQFNGTCDELVYKVYRQNFDAAVGDITILANRSLHVDFTLPYTESGVSMVVPIKDTQKKGAWTFLEPLKRDLWLASGCFFVFTGIVVWLMEHRINDEFRGTPARQLGTVFYFSFSTLVFAHKEKVLGNLTRVVVIIWLFVVLVLQQSYTASLTSILTVHQLQPTLNNLDDLLRNGSNVGYLNDSFMPDLLKRMKFNESKLISYTSPTEYNDALSNGSVAAIVDELPYLRVLLSNYCDKYTKVGPIYKTGGFGFAFPKGSPLVPDISREVLNLKESITMSLIEKQLYANLSCSDKGGTTTTWSSLTFKSFWGLFLITGITSILALVLHLAFFVHEHRKKLGSDDDLQNSLLQKLALLMKLYLQIDTTSDARAPKEPETKDEPSTGDIMASPDIISEPYIGDIMASPDTISGLQSPSNMSDVTHNNFEPEEPEEEAGAPLEEEGTPGREIHSPALGREISFADMLNESE